MSKIIGYKIVTGYRAATIELRRTNIKRGHRYDAFKLEEKFKSDGIAAMVSVEDQIMTLLSEGWVLYGSPMNMSPNLEHEGEYGIQTDVQPIGQAMVKHATELVADLLT